MLRPVHTIHVCIYMYMYCTLVYGTYTHVHVCLFLLLIISLPAAAIIHWSLLVETLQMVPDDGVIQMVKIYP